MTKPPPLRRFGRAVGLGGGRSTSFSDSSTSSGSFGSRVTRIAGVDGSSEADVFETVSVDVVVAPAVTITSPPLVVASTLGSVLASLGAVDVARVGARVEDDVPSVFGESVAVDPCGGVCDVVTCCRVVSGVEWLALSFSDGVADGL